MFQFIAFKKKLWQGFGKGEGIEERPRVLVVIVELVVFITFFSSIFLLIPAAIFKALENDETNSWDYTDSFYYTFITLSTIGFGDMVPGIDFIIIPLVLNMFCLQAAQY